MGYVAHDIAQGWDGDGQLLMLPVDVKQTGLESQSAVAKADFRAYLVVPGVFWLIRTIGFGFDRGIESAGLKPFRHRGIEHSVERGLVFQRELGRELRVVQTTLKAAELCSSGGIVEWCAIGMMVDVRLFEVVAQTKRG